MDTKSYFSISYARGLGLGGFVGPFRFGASQISVSRGSLRGWLCAWRLSCLSCSLCSSCSSAAFGTVAYMWLSRFDGMMQAKAPVKKAPAKKKAPAVKKTTATKKAPAKKTPAKKTPAKKTPAKKSGKKK